MTRRIAQPVSCPPGPRRARRAAPALLAAVASLAASGVAGAEQAAAARANPFPTALDSVNRPAERGGADKSAAAAHEPIGPPIDAGAAPARPAGGVADEAPDQRPVARADARPLAPASESRPLGADPDRAAGDPGAGGWLSNNAARTVGALALVIALILVGWAVFRRAATRLGGLGAALGPGGRAPSGVLSVLARYPVAKGQTLVLLHMDQRILLLSQGAHGFTPICEVTDPEEVASLLLKTRDEEGESLSRRFNGLLKFFEREDALATDDGPGPTTLRNVRETGFEAPPQPGAPHNDDDPVGSLRRRLSALREKVA